MVTCSSCSAVVAPGAFCRQCGARLDEPPSFETFTREVTATYQDTVPVVASASRRRTRPLFLFAVFAAAIAVGALVVAVVVFTETSSDETGVTGGADASGSTSTTTQPSPTETRPVGAVGIAVDGGLLAPAEESSGTVSAASCPGLRVSVEASVCIEALSGDRTFAVVARSDARSVTVEAYRMDVVDNAISASRLMSGTVRRRDLESEGLDVRIAKVVVNEVPTFIVVSSPDGRPATVQLIAPTADGQLETAGVLSGEDPRLAVDADHLLVRTVRRGDGGEVTGHLVSTVYPSPTGWSAVDELLDASESDNRLDQATSVQLSEPVRVQGTATSTTPVVTTVPPGQAADPTTTTTIPATTLPPATGLPLSYPSCDGSFVTVVGSRPASQVMSGLAAFPGSEAMMNEATCASLNPRFTTGTFIGEPIYVIFFGPYYSLSDAKDQCLRLGITDRNSCYVAPLTSNTADRTTRYGPLD